MDYSGAINQDATIRLFYNFSGVSWNGKYTINGLINTSTGSLHDSVLRLAETAAQQSATIINTRIDTLVGDIDEEGNAIADLNLRASRFREDQINEPYINTRWLNSTGSDNPPTDIGTMNDVDVASPRFSLTGTDAYIASESVDTATGGAYTLLNRTNTTSIPLDDSDPNVEVLESLSFEGKTWFVYRVSNLTAGDVYELDQTRFVRVVAREEDIKTLFANSARVDAELEHALLNLSDPVIEVFENEVSVDVETVPTVVPNDYNRSFSATGLQTIFYPDPATTFTGGFTRTPAIKDNPAAREYRKLVYLGDSIPTGTLLRAFDTAQNIDLVTFDGSQAVVKVFVPATSGGSTTVTVRPTPQNQVVKDWYFISTKTSDLRPIANELFFVNNVPTVSSTLNINYRYDANGGHGATISTTLAGVGGGSDVSTTVNLALPDGESITLIIDWQASQNRIRVEAIPNSSGSGLFIFDVEVGLNFTETRTIPAQPATTRNAFLGRATDVSVIATKPSDDDTKLVIVSGDVEVNTNYTYAQLFGGTDSGYLEAAGDIQMLDYQEFLPSVSTVTSLRQHSTLPQLGLFTTQYSDQTTLVFDTQVQAHRFVVIDSDGSGDLYEIGVNGGVIEAVKRN